MRHAIQIDVFTLFYQANQRGEGRVCLMKVQLLRHELPGRVGQSQT